MNSFNWTIRINELNPVIAGGQFKVAVPNPVVELQILCFESSLIFRAGVISSTGPSPAGFRLDIEAKRQIPTIGIGYHHFVSLKRRLDLLLNILATRRVEEQEFGRRGKMYRFGIQQNPANAIPGARPSGFTCNRMCNGTFLEIFG